MTGSPAVRHALAVLDLLGRSAEPLPAATLARELGIPRSSVYRILATLGEADYVTHDRDQPRFMLGVAAYELAWGYQRQAPLRRVAAPLLPLPDPPEPVVRVPLQVGQRPAGNWSLSVTILLLPPRVCARVMVYCALFCPTDHGPFEVTVRLLTVPACTTAAGLEGGRDLDMAQGICCWIFDY